MAGVGDGVGPVVVTGGASRGCPRIQTGRRFTTAATKRAAPAIEEEAGALEAVVHGSVEIVGAAFDADVGDAALGLSELGVEGVGLHLEFLHDVGPGAHYS